MRDRARFHKDHSPSEEKISYETLDEWTHWTPSIKSTLVFIVQEEQVLLIHKKTGLGQGKVNGPGGKLEGNESWIDCARREVKEELNIEISELKWVAELCFMMSDYPDILCHVFLTDVYQGEAIETREARPFWCPINQIPYEQMWTDDQYWLPRALEGERVIGHFVFKGEDLLRYSVVSHPQSGDLDLPREIASSSREL